MILTFEDEIVQCDHSNESSLAVLSYGTDLNFIILQKKV